MELNEIKKRLYKSKPKASFVKATKSGLMYVVSLSGSEDGTMGAWINVYFLIPLLEIGEATFEPLVESQLLIRYMIVDENKSSPYTEQDLAVDIW
jgi:hypothetical protein